MALTDIFRIQKGRANATDPNFLRAAKAWKATTQYLGPEPLLRYTRVLGFGGFGVVQLWRQRSRDGKHQRDLAVKSTSEYHVRTRLQNIKDEIRWMQLFEGHEHIVQLLDIGVKQKLARANNPESDQPIIVMEFLSRGSLYQLIGRVLEAPALNNSSQIPNDQKLIQYIPDRVLWRMFLCLTRVCIGMAYPPKAKTAGPYREIIQPGSPRNIVHLDIDPGNVFIQEARPDNAEHKAAPVCKLGDFGLATEWDEAWDEET
ncbi:kinase-like domain-containing protein [Xylariaceae sp. FL0804]|nr:kinase-like domain-containing protein [Xylariaceae sp. FL0804]